jgi:hypothetical protein
LAFQYSWADSFGPPVYPAIDLLTKKKELLPNQENVVGRG